MFSEPKTDRSRRTVPLSPAVVAMLRKHRTEQKGTRAFKGGFIECERHLQATTEHNRAVGRQAARHRERIDRAHTFDQALRCGVAPSWIM